MSLLARFLASSCLVLIAPLAAADDGDPDSAFSGDGKAVFTWLASYVQVETSAVAAFADGSIVTAGWVDNGNNNRDFAMARFTASGAVDTTFGNLGSTVVPFDLMPGGDDRAVGVFAQPDGKVLVAGYANIGVRPFTLPALLRLLPSGQPDPSFGPGGKQVVTTHPLGTNANFLFTIAEQQSDGKILLGGTCGSCPAGSPADLLVVRLLPSGAVDTTFGNQGWISYGRLDGDAYLEERLGDIAVDAVGRILLSGSTELPSDPNERRTPLIVCLGANGVPDPTFGEGGYTTLNIIGSWQADAIAPAVRKVGVGLTVRRIFVAINLDADSSQMPASLLIALGPTGTLIDTFGSNGFADLTRDEGTQIRALAVRADDTVTAAGWIDRTGVLQYDFFIARTTFDGDLDTRFDGNGVRRVEFDLTNNSYDRPTAMTLSAQRPVIVGNVQNLSGPEPWNTGVLRMKSDLIFASDNDR